MELIVVDDGVGPSRCEARFGNWGPVSSGAAEYLFFDRQLLNFDAGFRVLLSDVNVFDGRIVAIDAGYPEDTTPTIGVRAEDRLVDLQKNRRRKTYLDMSDSDIVSAITSRHRLTSELAIPGPVHATLRQHNQTDLEFLRARMDAIHADLWVEGDVVHAQLRSHRDLATVTLVRGGELRELTVQDDPLAGRYRVARGVCEANPGCRIGTPVELKGLGELFTGRYRVSEVRHTFDQTHGPRTSFRAETARPKP
jgi:phage protein D